MLVLKLKNFAPEPGSALIDVVWTQYSDVNKTTVLNTFTATSADFTLDKRYVDSDVLYFTAKVRTTLGLSKESDVVTVNVAHVLTHQVVDPLPMPVDFSLELSTSNEFGVNVGSNILLNKVLPEEMITNGLSVSRLDINIHDVYGVPHDVEIIENGKNVLITHSLTSGMTYFIGYLAVFNNNVSTIYKTIPIVIKDAGPMYVERGGTVNGVSTYKVKSQTNTNNYKVYNDTSNPTNQDINGTPLDVTVDLKHELDRAELHVFTTGGYMLTLATIN